MFQTPTLTRNEITQSYTDGDLTIYEVTDSAVTGYQPVETLTERFLLRYSEIRLGIQRYYSAKQNQIEIDRVLRVPYIKGITNKMIAETEDGTKYRIDLIQTAEPNSLDLTLVRYEQE